MKSQKLKYALNGIKVRATEDPERDREIAEQKRANPYGEAAERYNRYWRGSYVPVLQEIVGDLTKVGVEVAVSDSTHEFPNTKPPIEGATLVIRDPRKEKKELRITIDGMKREDVSRFDIGISPEGTEEVYTIDTFKGDQSLKFEEILAEIIDKHFK